MNTVLFDLDDTILDFRKSEAESIEKTLRTLGLDPSPELVRRYSAINEEGWLMFERGEITREECLSRRFRILFSETGTERDSSRAQTLYENFLADSAFVIDGAGEMLERVRRGRRLYVVSNGTSRIQRKRIALAGIARYFTGIFISEDLGLVKPSAEFFEACFSMIDSFDPAETIMVGDSLTSDVAGGINAGIRTVWYNPRRLPRRPDIVPDYEINDLSELDPLLNSL